MKVLNFGSCNIDYVYSLDHIVKPGETLTSDKLEIFPGGKGLNQSIAVAKGGGEVYHACCFGRDGQLLKDMLESNGVNLSLTQNTEEKSGHAIIYVGSSGENTICVFRGANGVMSKDYIDSVLEAFETGDILLLQNEINNIEYIIRRAYQKRMCIILNPSPITDTLNEIDFNMLTYLILNEIEAAAITLCAEPHECLYRLKAKYPKLKVVLTLGKRGCIYSDASSEIYQPAFCADAVDTTAAGDTFAGYFVAGLLRNDDCSKILKTAAAASAIAVTRKGAAPSIPHYKEVLESLGNMKEYKNFESRKDIFLSEVNRYIDANLKSANISELSDKLGYSTTYVSKQITALTGRSFSENLQDKRCTAAAALLINTELGISQVIKEVGYENETYFRKIFKRKYGKNPLEYRKSAVR